ncbi:aldo/keto reductase [Marinobacter vulgaris]|uniref:Aldo/keto reductase n=1 Tax=Marinobacter vulgaris TaxID=1928331 RepID=A0A2V3ZLI3_9GAMM|nr:aldo/keto reductase [Marinobacter vulgaris]PXX90305.1 aldo/keto reductase [Marinobacter vulgaris]TSJ69671.1 aldo/keto reductase [Marinobacter vulgaris]
MATQWTRRQFMAALAATGLSVPMPGLMAAPGGKAITRPIPSSGESLPVIGMGTWRTFNVGGDQHLVRERTEVLKTFFESGGTLVDSSPMYGSADDVMGEALDTLNAHDQVFAANKIWTSDGGATREQDGASRRKWSIERFDLQQVHNLVAWEPHLETLKQMKADGDIRYLGITTSHGRRHRDLAQIMEQEPLDFVQLTYNVLDREAEQRLLPLAKERGIAVIVNRPFQGGSLFRRYQSEPLPGWAAEAGCGNWAEFFLKFIVSHPAVTCAIPATTKVKHMEENMGAQYGDLPDEQQRRRMADYVAGL